ncbi:hypothetical protein [Natronomonas sp. LN261]|uniref:hypothetical protein n=1 Tax=Natronomonas sp. LN261 TaxID=2750669 RepID=UPI0015EF3F9E|nr:hypothetical protein [Natronomonas sp. LN261]
MAASAGVLGLSFGSGAFTQTTATRDFSISVANDGSDSAQLPIEPQGVNSDAVYQNGSGVLVIDASGLPPQAVTTFGRFSDLSDASSLNEEVFAITNENDTGESVSVTVNVEITSDADDATLNVAIAPTDDKGNVAGGGVTVATATAKGEKSSGSATVRSVSVGDQVLGGILINSAGAETVEADITIKADQPVEEV